MMTVKLGPTNIDCIYLFVKTVVESSLAVTYQKDPAGVPGISIQFKYDDDDSDHV